MKKYGLLFCITSNKFKMNISRQRTMSGRIIRYGSNIYYSMLCYSLHQHPRLGEPNLGLPLRIIIGYPPEFFRPKEKVRNNKRRMQIIISPILQTKLLPSPLQDKESKLQVMLNLLELEVLCHFNINI